MVALLFAHPDSAAIHTLDQRGDYFDIRTGDTWDLFFPGYSRIHSGRTPAPSAMNRALRYHIEAERGAVLPLPGYTDRWRFSANDFNTMRADVERLSSRRWSYSGGTDLVITGGWMPLVGEIAIDWELTASACIAEHLDATPDHTLGGVIELISRDIEQQLEDPNFGLPDANAAGEASRETLVQKVMVSAIGGIVAGLAKAGLGV